MRRLLLLVLVALGCVFLTQPPAAACDQPAGPLGQDLRRAEAVFTGTITEVSRASGTRARYVTYTVAVDRGYKGANRLRDTMKVTAPATRAACGMPAARTGESWLVVGRSVRTGSVATTSYEGTRLLTDGTSRQVTELLGAGTAFGTPPEPRAPELTTLTDDPPTGFWPLAMPGALLVLGGLVVVAVARGLGRPKGA